MRIKNRAARQSAQGGTTGVPRRHEGGSMKANEPRLTISMRGLEPNPAEATRPTKSDPEKDLAAKVKSAFAGDKELGREGIEVAPPCWRASRWN